MNLLHLRYICEVAKSGSISKAAHKLYINQPRLSKIIKAVEEDIGIKIFERTSQGVVPTHNGLLFIDQAKKIIHEADHLENMYKSHQKVVTFDMSVPRASYISTAFVNYLDEALVKDHEVKMNYHETNSMETIELVFNGDAELGIIRLPIEDQEYYLNLLELKGLGFKQLFTFHYQLIMSQDNPLCRTDIYFKDLRNQIELLHGDISLPGVPLARTNHLHERLSNARVINIYERGSQFEILDKLKDSYMWVSPMPKQTLERFKLVQKECQDRKMMWTDLLVYRKGYHLTKANHEFLEKLNEVICDIS